MKTCIHRKDFTLKYSNPDNRKLKKYIGQQNNGSDKLGQSKPKAAAGDQSSEGRRQNAKLKIKVMTKTLRNVLGMLS